MFATACLTVKGTESNFGLMQSSDSSEIRLIVIYVAVVLPHWCGVRNMCVCSERGKTEVSKDVTCLIIKNVTISSFENYIFLEEEKCFFFSKRKDAVYYFP